MGFLDNAGLAHLWAKVKTALGLKMDTSTYDPTGRAVDVFAYVDNKVVQPNWNQNIENAPDFIKNRPFYMESVNEVILSDKVLPALFVSNIGVIPLTIGTTYIVTLNGTEYEQSAFDDYGDLTLGDYYDDLWEGTGSYRWTICDGGQSGTFILTDSNAPCTLSIRVKDSVDVLFPETTISTFEEDGQRDYILGNFLLEEDRDYSVIINGSSYRMTTAEYEGYLILGDTPADFAEGTLKYGWSIYSDVQSEGAGAPERLTHFVSSDYKTTTLSLSLVGKPVTIPKKYLGIKFLTITVTLPAASWNATDKAQTVAAPGVTSGNAVTPSPAPASWEAAGQAGVRCTAQAANSLTFTCTTAPTADLTYNVLIQEVQ